MESALARPDWPAASIVLARLRDLGGRYPPATAAATTWERRIESAKAADERYRLLCSEHDAIAEYVRQSGAEGAEPALRAARAACAREVQALQAAGLTAQAAKAERLLARFETLARAVGMNLKD